MTKKILVWLSGWVDSAVSAYLLKKAWYDVTAWFMINYLAPEGEYCPTLEDIEVAKEVATYLEIPFFTFDYIEEYEKKVLNYMYEWYKNWITPNPDIMCNSEIKFKVFLDEALAHWFDAVATGHYAQIEMTPIPNPFPSEEKGKIKDSFKSFSPGGKEAWKADRGIFKLKKWIDPNKDQSYFLAWLSQFQLSKSMFPIGHLEKREVRKIALEAWLPNATRKDSQWICFVGKVDLSKFLEKKIQHKPGNIIDTSGKILGQHKWVFYYTIWQRKGLDIGGLAEPVFVIKKDIEKNELIVWTDKDISLYDDKLIIKNVNFLWNVCEFPLKAKAKIRYRQEDQNCEVFDLGNGKYEVKFEKPQRAIAAGQICAVYDENDFLVMSWVIE